MDTWISILQDEEIRSLKERIRKIELQYDEIYEELKLLKLENEISKG